MKRYLTLIAVLIVCLLFALVGCGSEGDSEVFDIPSPINSASVTAVQDKPLEIAVSELKLSAAANTFANDSTITLIEQSPTKIGSTGYSASSRSYAINAYMNTDKGKTLIKEIEQPVLLTIQKKLRLSDEPRS